MLPLSAENRQLTGVAAGDVVDVVDVDVELDTAVETLEAAVRG